MIMTWISATYTPVSSENSDRIKRYLKRACNSTVQLIIFLPKVERRRSINNGGYM